MKEILVKTAAVLDRLAEEAERPVEVKTKVAAVAVDPEKRAKIAAAFRDVTGEELSNELAEKIAADDTLFESLSKMAFARAKPSSLGEPSEKNASDAPAGNTRQERINNAYSKWGNSLLGRE